MASRSEIVQEMAEEFGTDAPDVITRIDRICGELTIDLLSQNDSRFARLERTQAITLTASTTVFKLNADFRTAQRISIIVNSSGSYLKDFTVLDEREFFRRASDIDNYEGTLYGYIQFDYNGSDGRGDYLTLGSGWSETGYLRFYYYRVPTENDTDIIKNPHILKTGIRAQFPEFNPAAAADIATYQRMRQGFVETPDTKVTGIQLRPSPKQAALNRFMHTRFRATTTNSRGNT